MAIEEELRNYVSKTIHGNIIHPNPLTPSELRVISICLKFFKMINFESKEVIHKITNSG